MILATLQCSLSIESRLDSIESMSELQHDPNKTKLYFTEGGITLK